MPKKPYQVCGVWPAACGGMPRLAPWQPGNGLHWHRSGIDAPWPTNSCVIVGQCQPPGAQSSHFMANCPAINVLPMGLNGC